MPLLPDRPAAGAHEIAEAMALLDAGREALQAARPDGAGGRDGAGLERAATALERAAALLLRADARLAADARATREAEHRIADGLQFVSLLLLRQARRAEGATERDALQVAATRVDAIAHLHVATLSAGPDVPAVLDVAPYLSNLCSALEGAHGGEDEAAWPGAAPAARRRPGVLRIAVEPWLVSPILAQRLGFIAAELTVNALRHAFPHGRAGMVRVTGSRREDGGYRLRVEDDGVGLPRGFDLRLRRSGLGLRMAVLLADHLRGRLVADAAAGARFTLTLPPLPASGPDGPAP